MIWVNNIEIDSTVQFTRTVDTTYDYVVQTLDYVTHSKFGANKETLTCTFAPKSAAAHDLLWDELCKPSDYITVKYPSGASSYETKRCIVYSRTTALQRKTNGVYKYGEISVTYQEA